MPHKIPCIKWWGPYVQNDDVSGFNPQNVAILNRPFEECAAEPNVSQSVFLWVSESWRQCRLTPLRAQLVCSSCECGKVLATLQSTPASLTNTRSMALSQVSSDPRDDRISHSTLWLFGRINLNCTFRVLRENSAMILHEITQWWIHFNQFWSIIKQHHKIKSAAT